VVHLLAVVLLQRALDREAVVGLFASVGLATGAVAIEDGENVDLELRKVGWLVGWLSFEPPVSIPAPSA
jgi:hypothetical protein